MPSEKRKILNEQLDSKSTEELVEIQQLARDELVDSVALNVAVAKAIAKRKLVTTDSHRNDIRFSRDVTDIMGSKHGPVLAAAVLRSGRTEVTPTAE